MNRIGGMVVIVFFMVCCLVTAHFYFIEKTPVVSVVMSTYNRAGRVGRAIESVLNQTFRDFEFIIVNDGSTDGTREIIRSYQKRDKRIILVENEGNKGLIASLNRGINLARGKYIARIDDDDEMLTSRLEKQVAYMEEHPKASVLATGYYSYKKEKDESGQEIRRRIRLGCPAPTEQVYINLHFANGMAHPTTMLRRSFLEKEQLQYQANYKSAEDYKLWTDVMRHGGEIHCIQEPLTEYTRAGDNPSSFYKDMVSSSKQIQKDILSDLVENPEEVVTQPKCDILKKMSEANKIKKILDQNRLEREIAKSCPPTDSNAWKVTHPYWNDYFIFTDEGRSIYRLGERNEEASVVSFNASKLVLKWKKWSQEEFICNRKTKECYLKGMRNGIK